MNYTDEQTTYIVAWYQQSPTMVTVQNLADELNKSPKSIIGKLSREGVYERAIYKNKSGESPVTKTEICYSIAENLGLEVENLAGLEKAPKATLKALEAATGAQQIGNENGRTRSTKECSRDGCDKMITYIVVTQLLALELVILVWALIEVKYL